MSQLSFPQVRSIIEGILSTSNPTKQELGRRFAYYLGFTPRPRGPNNGIDGLIEEGDIKIHFQSKLSKNELGKDQARKYYSDIKCHEVDSSIMLAGVGYKKTFHERLFDHNDIKPVKIHLLTLYDLFCETEAYKKAIQDLPKLSQLQKVDWFNYK